MQRLQSVETYQIFTGATFLLEPLQFLVFKKRSQILKQTYTWKLQVCLGMYDLLEGARRERVKTMLKMFSWGIQLLRFHKMTKNWTPLPPPCLHLFDFGNPPPPLQRTFKITSNSHCHHHHHHPTLIKTVNRFIEL